jgi:hypothetical protein
VDGPVVVNAGGSGAYRTSYDPAALAVLIDDLGSLSEVERAVLLGDTWALALAGVRSVGDVLSLAGGLGTLIEPSAWGIVSDVLGTLDRIVADRDRPALAATARRLCTPVLDALGWAALEGEDARAPLVRASAIRTLGTVGSDPAVRDEAASRFDSGVVEGDLAAAIIAVVAAMNRPGDGDEMLRRSREAKDPRAEERYRTGTAAIADRDHAVATFEHCFERFRGQDAPFVIFSLVQNRVGGRAVWESLAARWDDTLARVPPLMQSFLGEGIVALIGDRSFAERVAAFHRSHPVEVGQQQVDQSVERMLNGVAFADRARPTLGDALR